MALGDGRSLPASMLAAEAGVAASTASHHLSRNVEGGLLTVVTRGRHRDVTFGGSHHGGVRIDFASPAKFAFFQVSAIYVPADDLEGLAAELARRGIPGRDARRSS